MRVEHNQVRGGGSDRLLQFAELRELADPTVPLMRHRLADSLADMHLRVTEQNRDLETVLPIHLPNLPRSEARRVGKECVLRVDLGGRRLLKKKRNIRQIQH